MAKWGIEQLPVMQEVVFPDPGPNPGFLGLDRERNNDLIGI